MRATVPVTSTDTRQTPAVPSMELAADERTQAEVSSCHAVQSRKPGAWRDRPWFEWVIVQSQPDDV